MTDRKRMPRAGQRVGLHAAACSVLALARLRRLHGFLLLGLLVTAGCLRTSPGLVVRYTLDPQPSGNPTVLADPAPTAPDVLAVQTLGTAVPYRRHWVLRQNRFTLVQAPGHEWAEAPGEMVGRALIAELAAAGGFRNVGRAAERVQADWVVGGEITRFCLDQTQTPWQAVCELRLELRQTATAGGHWSGTLAAQAPLSENRLQAFPEAMNQAVVELLRQAVTVLAEQCRTAAVR
jgi:ABC-type uncharacterized transport system auxiliary subunit